MQARCGLLTASEMKLIITPTLKIASNDKERAHIYELAAQRITNYVEPSYVGDDKLDSSRANFPALRSVFHRMAWLATMALSKPNPAARNSKLKPSSPMRARPSICYKFKPACS